MNLSARELETLYTRVSLVRHCESQIMKEYFQDEMKTPVHLGIGAEAVSVGVHYACPSDSHYFGTYRNHALYLACSDDPDSFFGEMYGKLSGCGKGKAGSMHMAIPEKGLIATSAVVATTIPVAAGSALAARYNGSDRMSVVIFGDGAAEEGVFFETLNFASLKGLPLLFVCEDNELAIHAHSRERKGFHNFAELAKAFNLEFAQGDGSLAVDVVQKTRAVVEGMKTRGRPGLLHFSYFRFLEHVGPLEDFDKGYRAKPEKLAERWDPLPKLRAACLEAGMTSTQLDAIDAQILARIETSIRKAKSSPFPEPRELFTDIYAHHSPEAH
ncbi:MAG: thiamine pyrophosphate-dependent dehydrogenase E1 component subunit alpha [Bdellovibrionales bacterium]